jgi:hypothetical protein
LERAWNEARPNQWLSSVLRCSRLDVGRGPARRTTSSATAIGRGHRPTTKVNSSGDDNAGGLSQGASHASVGHYGVFSGKRWNDEIYPLLRDFVHVNS